MKPYNKILVQFSVNDAMTVQRSGARGLNQLLPNGWKFHNVDTKKYVVADYEGYLHTEYAQFAVFSVSSISNLTEENAKRVRNILDELESGVQ